MNFLSGLGTFARILHELPGAWRYLVAAIGFLALMIPPVLFLDMIFRFGIVDWDRLIVPPVEKPGAVSPVVPPPVNRIVAKDQSQPAVYQQLGDNNRMYVNVSQSFYENTSKQTVNYVSKSGAKADIDIYVIYAGTSWKFASPSEFEHPDIVLDFIESSRFTESLRLYQALIAVGLASNKDMGAEETGSEDGPDHLSLQRALTICSLLQPKVSTTRSTSPLFGIGLGRDVISTEKKNASQQEMDEADSRQRPVVILGVRSASSELADPSGRSEMVRRMLDNGKFDRFNPREYSIIVHSRALTWLQMDRVHHWSVPKLPPSE